MGDGISSSAAMLGTPLDYPMDFDYMDELLLDGCWLETTDGSEFLNPSPSTSAIFFDPSFVWPASEPNNDGSSINLSPISGQERRQSLSFPGTSFIDDIQETRPRITPPLAQNMTNYVGDHIAKGSELSRRWWIGPTTNPDPSTSVMQRLIRALGYINDFTKDKDVLVQLWVPVNRGGKRVLTTSDQPFSLNPNCQRLASYRDISVNYQFSAQEDSKDLVGLPGRVFLGKVPEWTPDVQFFRSDEYPRVRHAQEHDVRGTLALPVFEQGSRTCIGVIEVVMTTQEVKYHPELEKVCKALEAVDLRSSEIPGPQNVKEFDKSYQAALPEILEVLRYACETHRLPLAQTWIPCIQQGKHGSRHSDENYLQCVSTVDHACYVADPKIQPFHEACSEHHLLKGQGVAGEAFMTNQPRFSPDITSYAKTEYPLSHHARMFDLCGAVAIRLRSIHTGTTDFVLEFFLPMDCRDPEEQKKMLTSLSTIIRQVCQSLRVVTDKELAEESDLQGSEVIVPSESELDREERPKVENTHLGQDTGSLKEVRQRDNNFSLTKIEKPRANLGESSMECMKNEGDFSLKESDECGGNSSFGEGGFSSLGMEKTGERRRRKAEKTITLQVLRRYFAGSLKDAAKSIGVCPTTLKRICRQHGIKRWPSRKIKKVGHSLQKLQLVIDSVHGASGTFQIDSFYTNFPELASPKFSGTNPFSTSKLSDELDPSSTQPSGGIFVPQGTVSKSPSSSCSQSSSSSQCCSSGMQQPQSMLNIVRNDDQVVRESSGCSSLKRVGSEAELHVSSEGGKKLPRSRSHRSLREPSRENLVPLPENSGGMSQEMDTQRVKVTYGDEKIRFRMQNKWGFKDLLEDITKRFSIEDISRYDLKYLDDDDEWVLLTCDADLEECVDVCRSSQNHTIKLLLQVSHHLLERSICSSAPS